MPDTHCLRIYYSAIFCNCIVISRKQIIVGINWRLACVLIHATSKKLKAYVTHIHYRFRGSDLIQNACILRDPYLFAFYFSYSFFVRIAITSAKHLERSLINTNHLVLVYKNWAGGRLISNRSSLLCSSHLSTSLTHRGIWKNLTSWKFELHIIKKICCRVLQSKIICLIVSVLVFKSNLLEMFGLQYTEKKVRDTNLSWA